MSSRIPMSSQGFGLCCQEMTWWLYDLSDIGD